MFDQQNNQIDTFRTRLAFLAKPGNTAIWHNFPPLKFTGKAAFAQTLFTELEDIAGKQSLRITGAAADKEREETDLENTAHTLAKALVIFAHDSGNQTLAARYDLPLSGWRRLRDEQLVEKTRQLRADAFAASTDTDAQATGITPAAIATLDEAIAGYEAFIFAPAAGIGERKALTVRLKTAIRELKAVFDQLDGLSLQFRGTPEGDRFVDEWLATAQIIDRGKGPKTDPAEETPPTPGPTA